MRAAQQESPPESTEGIRRLYSTDLANETEFLAARARSLGSARANAALAALDLKVRSYSVLSLACSGMQPSQRELAEFLALDPSQIVALVDQLERRGAVVRMADPRDRRSNIIAATDAGHRLFTEAARLVDSASNESLKTLTPGERDQLRNLLRRIALPPED
ncbi:MarR family winged helix-turn-helix transcriptional regulator [Arthrobacter gengyunqii]|uniref:MarR family winged helix-turn-helix transcriptional regulator n=1 Tax=Arthrobacter gengyunqii TaxID=2886940 RepID=A0A9X1M1B1_9MICC|nr:MarR family winged helix-turn-helix transcriptional regulator [Arthrobacter gengyunqii]MCC3268564.1 MarR family winged helix-turn-helix transcriptional regulator [Arthrobacter gengyunqii]UOY95952.1 MarR family winged helix-turn-helix transcriptional regulator [Arthrobacter gengyunqii]